MDSYRAGQSEPSDPRRPTLAERVRELEEQLTELRKEQLGTRNEQESHHIRINRIENETGLDETRAAH